MCDNCTCKQNQWPQKNDDDDLMDLFHDMDKEETNEQMTERRLKNKNNHLHRMPRIAKLLYTTKALVWDENDEDTKFRLVHPFTMLALIFYVLAVPVLAMATDHTVVELYKDISKSVVFFNCNNRDE